MLTDSSAEFEVASAAAEDSRAPKPPRRHSLWRSSILALLPIALVVLLTGCGTYFRQGLDAAKAREAEAAVASRRAVLSPELEDKILALNPDHVSADNIRNVLSNAPAPQIMGIHGGIYPVEYFMYSFCDFLIGMGYPEASLRHPADGSETFSCYESATMIAGMAAWYYEKEGLRPMLVGHSQGGMQVVKVLHVLAITNAPLYVWNPCTWQKEDRTTILDLVTNATVPANETKISFASAVCAGGITRFLPNQWDMLTNLRDIPDSVVEFTGFYEYFDPLGGDFFGFGSINNYTALGTAQVRTLRLPTRLKHFDIPDTRDLLKYPEVIEWIEAYEPVDEPHAEFKASVNLASVYWAAEVWHTVKKHWVLELQRLILAQREAKNHGR